MTRIMAGPSESRRLTSLKTYSRRVSKSSPVPSAKKSSQRDSPKIVSPEGDQRRVLGSFDENHHLVTIFRQSQQAVIGSALHTIAISKGQVLKEIDFNRLSTSGPKSLLIPSEKASALQTTSSVLSSPTHLHPREHVNKGLLLSPETSKHPPNLITSSSSLQVSHKAIVSNLGAASPETKQNAQYPQKTSHLSTDHESGLESHSPYLKDEQSLPTKLRHPITQESPILESPKPHLENPSKKRPYSDSQLLESKRNRPSIKSYFKPIPTSSSPPPTHSIDIFSDNTDAPSSPPTSPVSDNGSPKYRPLKKKSRRHISIKPSLPPVIMKDYEEKSVSSDEVSGNRLNLQFDFRSVDAAKKDAEQKQRDQERDRRLRKPVHHSQPIDIPPRKKPVEYEQLQISTSKDPFKYCASCNMHFNTTLDKDVKHHNRFHAHHAKSLLATQTVVGDAIWTESRDGVAHRIHVSRRNPQKKERLWFEQHLEISERNGLAGSFEKRRLWDHIYIDAHFAYPHKGNQQPKQVRVPRYRVYAYSVGGNVVAVAVLEHTLEAGAYCNGVYGPSPMGGSSTSVGQEYVDINRRFQIKATVDRLWTDPAHRHKGIATTLLDVVRGNFCVSGYTIPKSELAVSAPTADGRGFAAKYFALVFPGCPFVVGLD